MPSPSTAAYTALTPPVVSVSVMEREVELVTTKDAVPAPAAASGHGPDSARRASDGAVLVGWTGTVVVLMAGAAPGSVSVGTATTVPVPVSRRHEPVVPS